MNNNNKKKIRRSPLLLVTKFIGILLCICGLGLIGYYLWSEYNRPPEVFYETPVIERSESSESSAPETIPDSTIYPEGKLIIVPQRKTYTDGEIQFYIPRLNLTAPVYNGVDEKTLEKGLGLFDYSQLPGPLEQNGNISIAGHRDIFGKEFYFLDTVTDGDLIYLTYQGILYTYEYETTFITDPYNWDPIRVKGYPCITLQSCTPIGVANMRFFVVARLIEVTPGGTFPDEEIDYSGLRGDRPLDDKFPVVTAAIQTPSSQSASTPGAAEPSASSENTAPAAPDSAVPPDDAAVTADTDSAVPGP